VTGVGETIEALSFEPRHFVLLLPPISVSTAAVFHAFDERRAATVTGAEADAGNDLEEAALAVAPRLAAWRDRLGSVCGLRPRLAGSGSTWFVEGGPRELGLEGVPYLDLDGERAPLRAVGTLAPWSDEGGS
jgi:4-diphosphocytidyl-2-C-methyl-D-erythritol kinase